jgi:peptidyl-dipeptidase A
VSVPGYYHNYLLGELFAAQLRQHIARQVPAAVKEGKLHLLAEPRIGAFLIESVFKPGRLYPWDELVKRATGAPLSAAAFLAEIR